MPNVVGLTQSAATTAITNAGLVLGTVTQQASATVAAGNVISQSPSAGGSVASGSAVNLVVSTGPTDDIGARFDALLAFVTGLPPGTSLADKVTSARAAYANQNITGACRILTDVTREARAQSGKRLSRDQATRVITEAREIRAAMGCS